MSTHTTPDLVALSAEWHTLEVEIQQRRGRQAEIAATLGLKPVPSGDAAALREFITEQVCREYGVTLAALRSRDRHEPLVIARQMCFALLRHHTGVGLVLLGEYLGRDHGTVLHALRAVAARLETNPAEAARHLRLTTAIRTRFA